MNHPEIVVDAASADPATSPPGRARVWPAVAVVAVFWALILVAARVAPGSMGEFLIMLIGPLAGMVLLAVWWFAFSRIETLEKRLVATMLIAAAAAAWLFRHPDIRADGLVVLVLPFLMTVWAIGTAALTWLRLPHWRAWIVSAGIAAYAIFACLIRIEGVTSGLRAEWTWRWSPTKDERFQAWQAERAAAGAQGANSGTTTQTTTDVAEEPLVASPGDWLEFRGPRRDGRVEGVRIDADWEARPPALVWKQPIGAGWSSFCVVGERLFTQEQRGDDEVVSCYDAGSGRELWAFLDRARFQDFVSGAGPRGTPTFRDGRIYAFGASGGLHCLDARTGRRVWSRDVAAHVGAVPPMYGFASSPLVADGMVTVFAAGPDGKSVAAFRQDSGEPVWAAGEGLLGYCSVQRETIGGTVQYLCTSNAGSAAYDLETGRILWSNAWPLADQPRVVQPARIGPDQILIGTGMADGVRLLEISPAQDGAWTAKELWTTTNLKPYFNDVVIHDGCVFGYDGTLLSCLDLATQKRLWKKRGYDSGQLLLLADQGLLLVVTEEGEVALLTADRRGPKELGRFRPFTAKTWNHPVIAHGRLFVRNGEEAACYAVGTGEP